MATLDTTAFDYALKTRYSKEEVMTLHLEDQPLLAMIPRDERFVGKNFVFAVKYADLAGRSVSFSTAQANKSASKGVDFTVTRVKDYALASIDNETIEASQSDEGALLQALEDEMDSAIFSIQRSLGIALYGNGSGELGSISSVSTTTITLTSADDAGKFEAGMKIVAATADTAAAKNSAQAVTVASVDRDAGTVTMSVDVTSGANVGGTAWAAADELFQEGDYVSASDRNKVSGLKAWIPDSAPGATSFFGVDRSVDTQRLGGVRYSGSGVPLHEALINGQTAVCKWGGRPTHVFISFERMKELINLLGTKVEFHEEKIGDIGFEGIVVRGPKGKMKVYADINCPANHAYLLSMKDWKLRSLNAAPHILKYKGGNYFREATADAIEIRVGFYGNVTCKAPGNSGVITSFGA